MFDKKLKALALRREGMSIKSIAAALGVARSTSSLWCRDIKLTEQQKDRQKRIQIEAGHRGRILGAESNRRKKLENIAAQEGIAATLVGDLTSRDKLMLGIGLYWGEGIKAHGSSGTALVNSDPAIILFARDWFEQLGVKREEFNPYIYASEIHRSRELVIRKFWSKHLSIPLNQFHKVIFLKGRPKKVYENHDLYYGVLALRVAKGATLKYKILGLIKACKEMSM